MIDVYEDWNNRCFVFFDDHVMYTVPWYQHEFTIVSCYSLERKLRAVFGDVSYRFNPDPKGE